MRIGGPILDSYQGPLEWAKEVKARHYNAAYCPVTNDTPKDIIKDYMKVAKKEDIIISEVGVWNNPLVTDDNKRKQAIEYCQKQLALADMIQARCCVNIAGSKNKEKWDGPHIDNFSSDTFDLIVETVREIIDGVNPQNTFYTLELMPWIFPDSADSYLDLIKAINREKFAVHLDPVNIITSPRSYYENGKLIEDCFQKLGPYIKSCHAKDIIMSDEFTIHLNEVIPGKGFLDYKVYLKELRKLDPDISLMLEHLSTNEEYEQAYYFINQVANEIKKEH